MDRRSQTSEGLCVGPTDLEGGNDPHDYEEAHLRILIKTLRERHEQLRARRFQVSSLEVLREETARLEYENRQLQKAIDGGWRPTSKKRKRK